jgi:hypothetical protein
MFIFHEAAGGRKFAELTPDNNVIDSVESAIDFIAEANYSGCSKLIVHESSLDPAFFDLKTRLAGEILQKFSNYRMQLAVIGDFSKFKSKSLQDFMRESNRFGIISFLNSIEEVPGLKK